MFGNYFQPNNKLCSAQPPKADFNDRTTPDQSVHKIWFEKCQKNKEKYENCCCNIIGMEIVCLKKLGVYLILDVRIETFVSFTNDFIPLQSTPRVPESRPQLCRRLL